ncbi:MAG: peptide deformylase [Bacteroidales bacterium]|nr:peptide deformylase [Bacteroidales bacterium]
MIQPIYLYGSEVLRKKAEPVDLSRKEEIMKLIQDLKDTLANAEGCGLAAPQIGVSQRVVIVDAEGMEDMYDYLKGFRRVLVNPVILSQSEQLCEYNEGCLSIPGIYADVRRPATMTVEYYDENLEKVTETFDRFGCRMIQHELSHLDGDMFVDHVAPIRKKMITKKLANIAHGRVGARYNTKIK